MTTTKRKPAARLLALLLAVVMLGGLLAVSAQAADMTNVKQYGYYVCIGDSIAAGYGPYATWIRGFERVPVAYHSLVADATGADFQSLAYCGMRSVEARWLLDDGYEGDDVVMTFNGMSDFVNWMDTRTSASDPKPDFMNDAQYAALKEYYGPGSFRQFYKDNVASADLLTLGLGLNDIFLYAMNKTAQNVLSMSAPQAVATYLYYMNIGYQRFFENWAPLIQAIKKLNPNITIVVVGLYNPFSKVKLTDASWANVGRVADGVVASVNAYLQQQADTLGYKYADVTDTEICETVPFTNPDFFSQIVRDCHPTIAGHLYIMEQILAQLPERSADDPTPSHFPFRDVTPARWYYNDVYYCWQTGLMNGVSEHVFQPNGTTTRAQLVTVLYRMAHEPDVSGQTCPFTDVDTNSWYGKAVIWGYNNGVINGTSPKTFSPNASVTREQLITMLYRYSGDPQPTGSLDMFSDAARVSAYAVPAVIWGVQNGIISGMGDGTFNPKGDATRAQLAKILHMYMIR